MQQVTDLPVQKRREILDNHEDTREVDLGPKEIPFWLGGASFDFAEEQEIDLSGIITAFQQGSENPKDNLDGVCKILYVGTLPFGTDISLAEIKLMVSLESVEGLINQIFPDVEELADDDTAGKSSVSQNSDSAVGAMR